MEFPGTAFAKGVLLATPYVQMRAPRYCTYKVSSLGTTLAKSDIIFAPQRLTVKKGYTMNCDTL